MSTEPTAKTFNVSSNSTVFLKYFLPTIWTVFFGTLFVVILFAGQVRVGSMDSTIFKFVYGFAFLSIIALLYFTVFKLKRVELNEKSVYVTNYVKIYRYPFSSIESIKSYHYGWSLIYRIELKEAGFFGKRITFLAHKKRLVNFLKENPEVALALKMEDVLIEEK
jgi:hypothetical protein